MFDHICLNFVDDRLNPVGIGTKFRVKIDNPQGSGYRVGDIVEFNTTKSKWDDAIYVKRVVNPKSNELIKIVDLLNLERMSG